MKVMHRVMIVKLCVCVATLSLAPASVRAEDPVAEWAPADAIMFVGVPNCDDLYEACKKTRSYSSLEDPAMKKTIQPFKKFAENAQKLIAKEIGLENPKELEIYPHGGLAFFLRLDMPGGEDDEEPKACLVAEMGQDAERARAIADKIVRRCVEKGGERKVVEFGGTEIITIEFKPGEDASEEGETASPPSSKMDALMEGVEIEDMQYVLIALSQMQGPESFTFAFADTRILLGTDAEVIKDTVARIRSGAEGSLAGVRDVRSFASRVPGKPDLLFVINFPALFEGLARSDEDKKIMTGLSLDAMGALVMSMQVAPAKDLDARLRGFMRIESRPHGMGRILMMQNIDTEPPSGVSADTIAFASINLSPSMLFEEILAVTEQMDPESAEMMRSSMTIPQADGSTLDIKSDVIGQLIGPLTFGLEMSKPFDADHVNLIARLGHKSRDAMAKLAAMLPAGMFMPGEMLGHKVFGTPMMPGLAMGFTDRAVIPFATRKALENYIRSEGQSGRGLAQTEGFRHAMKYVPQQSCVVFYTDSPRMVEAQIALAEKAKDDTEDDSEVATLSSYIIQGIMQSTQKDIELLKASRKYESSVILTVSTESDGLAIDMASFPANEDTAE